MFAKQLSLYSKYY